ncbi:AraC family transcriptional regulator [Alkaliphilus sp. MSJ-5]|uniref:AraC family transcriptional regulator n=1 Tax=Alkaliphilus flagellatus TaxID=2841507 RepID=A0ABS6G0S0_9FIRM|nr:AraC family transcriptional regulator [Alkaliphilus flagellatus]MBU5674941.1 AraC family transcriptional regulator [Alkaliphilus flagellatus]
MKGMLSSFDKKLETIDGFETDHVKILYYDLPQNYCDDYRSYQHVRFCTILDGEKNIKINDTKKITYSKDNYLLLAPNTKVHMEISQNTKALVFELSNDLVCKVLDSINLNEDMKEGLNLTNSFFLGANRFNIYEDMNNMFTAYQSGEKNNAFLVDLYAQKLVFELAKQKMPLNIFKSNRSSPISIALRYIEENIETKINVNHLAKELNMSVSNFSHLFKKTVGVTPITYINNKKLTLSLKYLRNENVTEVAFRLGYDNISYFIRLFKDKYLVTPKQYKLTNFE